MPLIEMSCFLIYLRRYWHISNKMVNIVLKWFFHSNQLRFIIDGCWWCVSTVVNSLYGSHIFSRNGRNDLICFIWIIHLALRKDTQLMLRKDSFWRLFNVDCIYSKSTDYCILSHCSTVWLCVCFWYTGIFFSWCDVKSQHWHISPLQSNQQPYVIRARCCQMSWVCVISTAGSHLI